MTVPPSILTQPLSFSRVADALAYLMVGVLPLEVDALLVTVVAEELLTIGVTEELLTSWATEELLTVGWLLSLLSMGCATELLEAAVSTLMRLQASSK